MSEKKNRLKPEMWAPLAAELSIPWRAAEAMHWQLGEADMARRAGVVPFALAGNNPNANQANLSGPPQVQTPGNVPYHLRPPGPATPTKYTSTGYPSVTEYERRVPGPESLKDHGIRSVQPHPAPLANIPASNNPNQNILPSMAELDRGLTAAASSVRHTDRSKRS
jgi:hypothetical protein